MLYPLKAGALCTARRARIITLGLLALAALYNSTRWFELRSVRANANANGTEPNVAPPEATTAAVGKTIGFVAANATGGEQQQQQLVGSETLPGSEEQCYTAEAAFLQNRIFVLMYYSWLYTVFKGLLPISLLAVLNTLLVARVRRSSRIRKRFTFNCLAADHRCSLTNAGGNNNVSLLVQSVGHQALSLRVSGSKAARQMLVLPVASPGISVRFATPGAPAAATGKKPSASSTTSTELGSSRSSRRRSAKDASPTGDSSLRASPAGGANGGVGTPDAKCERSSGSFGQRIRPPSMNMNYSVTLMLAAIVAVFVVCQLPCVVYNFAFAIDRDHVINDFGWQLLSLLRNFTGTLQSAVNFILFCLLGKHFRALLMKRFPLLLSAYDIVLSCLSAVVSRSKRTRDRETTAEPARVGSTPGPGFNHRSSGELPASRSSVFRPAHHCIQQHATYLKPLPCVCCERPINALFMGSRGGGGGGGSGSAVSSVGGERMSRSCIDVSVSEMHHCVVYYRSPPSSPFPSTSGPKC